VNNARKTKSEKTPADRLKITDGTFTHFNRNEFSQRWLINLFGVQNADTPVHHYVTLPTISNYRWRQCDCALRPHQMQQRMNTGHV